MTDSLRDRIAAVMEDHDVEQEGANYWQCVCGEKFYFYPSDHGFRSWQEHLADAVIAALGLRKEAGRNVVWSAHGLTDKATRYITDWENDE